MTSERSPRRLERAEFAGLFLLTVVTGMVDAASFLGLGHVFTANMTGNVLLLGFSLAGSAATRAAGLSATLTLTSLGGFVAGAAGGALLSGRRASPRLLSPLLSEAVMVGAAAALVGWVGPGRASVRYGSIALLGLAMGIQNATVRRLGRRDVNTTVLTTALGGLVADAVEVGGRPVRSGRRLATVVLLFAGAGVGAAFERLGPAWALLAALVVFVTGAAALLAGRQPTA